MGFKPGTIQERKRKIEFSNLLWLVLYFSCSGWYKLKNWRMSGDIECSFFFLWSPASLCYNQQTGKKKKTDGFTEVHNKSNTCTHRAAAGECDAFEMKKEAMRWVIILLSLSRTNNQTVSPSHLVLPRSASAIRSLFMRVRGGEGTYISFWFLILGSFTHTAETLHLPADKEEVKLQLSYKHVEWWPRIISGRKPMSETIRLVMGHCVKWKCGMRHTPPSPLVSYQ